MLAYHQLIENVALPMSDRLTRSSFWKLSRNLDALKKCSHGHLADLQAHRLIQANCNHAPARERLETMPPVSKSELEAGFPDKVINSSIDPAELRFASTRGTTQRMICVHDFAKRESMRAAMVCTLRESGYRIGMPMVEIPPNICNDVCGELGESDDGVWTHVRKMATQRKLKDGSAWQDLRGLVERHWIYRRKTYSPFSPLHGTTQPDSALDQYIDQLQKDRPHTVKGLTTYLFQIAKRLLQRSDVTLNVPAIRPLGSGASPLMRQTIESAFNGRFYDDYGSAELGPIAFACKTGNGMHVFANQFIVEVVNENGEAVPKGQTGEVVVTDLVNHAMPLFRYRIGDLGRIHEGPCGCGNPAPRIEIEGRIQDSVRTSNGQRETSRQIAELMYAQPDLDQFQLVEKRNGAFELLVVASHGCELDKSKYQKLMVEVLGGRQRIQVRNVRTILPESSGKFRWVKARSAGRTV